jgi:hypothetical protein
MREGAVVSPPLLYSSGRISKVPGMDLKLFMA